jgi:ferrochelatase
MQKGFQMPAQAVLFVGFGGPTSREEIVPFLERVVAGRGIPRERVLKVAEHYYEVGGKSPYNEITFAQRDALRARLEADGLPLPIYVGMRNWDPYLKDTMREMAGAGITEAVGVVLAPQRCDDSWERYLNDVKRAQEEAGTNVKVDYIGPWHDHPLFIEAAAERVEDATGIRRGSWPAEIPLVGTAHSIPTRVAYESRYREEIGETIEGIGKLLGIEKTVQAYQSRSGDPRTPWLEPDVSEVLAELKLAGTEKVVVLPVGFICDNVEVLFDLDIEAQADAKELGLGWWRPPTVSDHPAFIQMLSEKIRETALAGAGAAG